MTGSWGTNVTAQSEKSTNGINPDERAASAAALKRMLLYVETAAVDLGLTLTAEFAGAAALAVEIDVKDHGRSRLQPQTGAKRPAVNARS